MNKLLYISSVFKNKFSGGGRVASRNYNTLKYLLREENVTAYLVRPNHGKRSCFEIISKIKDTIMGFGGGLSAMDVHHILNLLKEQHFDMVFIDSSLLGILARIIHKHFPTIKIIVYFHNVEYDYMVSTTWKSHDYKHLFWITLAKKNERNACRFADKTICITQKDSNRLLRIYHRKADAVIPVTLDDDYNPSEKFKTAKTQRPLQALFVGSYFSGNLKGLIWFYHEVLPQTDLRLVIVGSGMNQLKQDITENDQLQIFDSVHDLSPFYEQADFVILPIISGGGMKVKTAEALKYGKYIVGTKEALLGYGLDSTEALECNTKEEFIKAIHHLALTKKYNSFSRRVFLEKFSYHSSINNFKKILSSCNP